MEDIKKEFLNLLVEDNGFRNEVKRLLDIDNLESEIDELKK